MNIALPRQIERYSVAIASALHAQTEPTKHTIYKSLKQSLPRKTQVAILEGDASSRSYFRISAEGNSVILMVPPANLPNILRRFSSIHAILSSATSSVPAIYQNNLRQNFALIEDLGDDTLQKYCLIKREGSEAEQIYKSIISLIARIQKDCTKTFKQSQIYKSTLHFTPKFLMREVDFTIHQFFSLYLKRPLSRSGLSTLRSAFGSICKGVCSQRPVLTHRDLHSRNIMYCSGRGNVGRNNFALIDFQDARLGPYTYDIASLLADSYNPMDPQEAATLAEYFRQLCIPHIDPHTYRIQLDAMIAQRVFKQVGSFASFYNLHNNARYLHYIGNSLGLLRRHLSPHKRCSDLLDIIITHAF